MDMQTYLQEESLRTLSDSFHNEYFTPGYLVAILSAIKSGGELVEAYKKALYYGKVPPEGLFQYEELEKTLGPEAKQLMDLDAGDVQLLHAAFGMAGEISEFSQEVLKGFLKGAEVDKTKALTELGDILWYYALALRQLDSTFEEEAERNIAKLRARYPEKFTEEAATVRDLEAEQTAATL